jgi:hypothetical protein
MRGTVIQVGDGGRGFIIETKKGALRRDRRALPERAAASVHGESHA